MSLQDELTPERQLEAWLRGESLCPNTRDECCPDFSCCIPSALVPIEQRQAFVDATQEVREAMCVGFLGGLSEAASDSKVHIAGQIPDPEDVN